MCKSTPVLKCLAAEGERKSERKREGEKEEKKKRGSPNNRFPGPEPTNSQMLTHAAT